MPSPGDITELLAAVRDGNQDAESLLARLVYAELHTIARRYMRRERPDHTLQPTALVNETYLRLMRTSGAPRDRVHFFAAAATMMRRVLVDHAREHSASKRGGSGKQRVELDDFMAATAPRLEQWLILDQALSRLAEFAPRQARLVELVFFGGLTLKEASSILVPPLSERTAKRDWEAARSWLQAELRRAVPSSP